ncbi:MAG TPA: ABC transporter permease [Dehalococcoidales bacterium]|nr:ABC transporter permease [Dehalococcoidales bacterium]
MSTTTAEAETKTRPHHTLWGDAFIRLRRNKLAVSGAIIILIIAVAAIIVPWVSPYAYDKQDMSAILEGPSRDHPLGTDILGRDVMTRLIYGARTSLAVGLFTQFIVLIIGIPIGAFAGSLGGRADNLLMRFVDVMYAFPDILLIILLRSILGGSIYMLFLAIGLVAWVGVARLIRGQILSLKQRDFVVAARAAGASNLYRTTRLLIPNALGPIIVSVTFNVPRAIFMEAALSYIGIGVDPTIPSWGTMVRDGFDILFASPYVILFPAVAIAILMLSFTFLGDGLRDALDPRLRK